MQTPCVLVVEDEPLIGLQYARDLRDAGFTVVGPAHSVAQAMELIARDHVDLALLDYRLGTETAEPIALDLMRRNIPVVFVTGWTAQLPSPLRNRVTLPKPVRRSEMIDALQFSRWYAEPSPQLSE
jgi:CheY-like chemotaxis protein